MDGPLQKEPGQWWQQITTPGTFPEADGIIPILYLILFIFILHCCFKNLMSCGIPTSHGGLLTPPVFPFFFLSFSLSSLSHVCYKPLITRSYIHNWCRTNFTKQFIFATEEFLVIKTPSLEQFAHSYTQKPLYSCDRACNICLCVDNSLWRNIPISTCTNDRFCFFLHILMSIFPYVSKCLWLGMYDSYGGLYSWRPPIYKISPYIQKLKSIQLWIKNHI